MELNNNEKKITVDEGKDLIKKVHENIFKYYEFIKDIEPSKQILNELVTKLEIIDSLSEDKISINEYLSGVRFNYRDDNLWFSESIFYYNEDLVYNTYYAGFVFNKNKVVINMTISEDKPEYMDTIDCYGDENYIQRSEKMKFIFEEKDDKIECDCDRYYYTFDSNGKSSGGTFEDIENNVIVFDKPENFNNMIDFSGDTKAK